MICLFLRFALVDIGDTVCGFCGFEFLPFPLTQAAWLAKTFFDFGF